MGYPDGIQKHTSKQYGTEAFKCRIAHMYMMFCYADILNQSSTKISVFDDYAEKLLVTINSIILKFELWDIGMNAIL